MNFCAQTSQACHFVHLSNVFYMEKLKIPAHCLPDGVSSYSQSQHGFMTGKSYLTNLIFFTERMVCHWNKLSVEVVELLSLKVFKKHANMPPGDMV